MFIFAKTFINTNNEGLDGIHPRCLKELRGAFGTSFFLILMLFPQLTNYRMDRCNTTAHMYLKGRNPFLCTLSFIKTVLGVAERILNGSMRKSECDYIFFQPLTSAAKETGTLKGLKRAEKYNLAQTNNRHITGHQERRMWKQDRVNWTLMDIFRLSFV